MSIKVASAVWEYSEQSGSALLMLLAIADHANDDGYCWPSVPTLAKKCRVSERQAKRLIRQLVEAGDLEIEIGGGRGHTTLYKVVVKGDIHDIKGDVDDTVYDIKGDIQGQERVTSMTQRVTSRVIKGDTHDTQNHKEPSIEPSYINKTLISGFAAEVTETELPNEERDEMVTAIAKVVKETYAVGKNESTFKSIAEAFIRDGVTEANVSGFGVYWGKHGWYPGPPSLKTLLDDMKKYLHSKNGHGPEQVPEGMADSHGRVAPPELKPLEPGGALY